VRRSALFFSVSPGLRRGSLEAGEGAAPDRLSEALKRAKVDLLGWNAIQTAEA
jgi:hypothetical protein